MTRTHVEEGELVELQRKALSVFNRLDNLTERLGYLVGRNREPLELDIDNAANAASLAREVSDAVDQLTEYVRHQRENQFPPICGKWDCPE
jgi:hypothetical protein